MQPKIVFCQITNKHWYEHALANIKLVSQYVDHSILVTDYNESSDPKPDNTTIIYKPFDNNFTTFRQYYIDEARRIEADYVLFCDTDEVFSNTFLTHIRNIVQNSPGINSFELYWQYILNDSDRMDSNEISRESPCGFGDKTNWWKQCMIRLEPDIVYTGNGYNKNIHEYLTSEEWHLLKLPKKYYITHTKSSMDVWRNSARNIIISGGALGISNENPLYSELHPILEELKLTDWCIFEQYCKNGNIDKRIKDIFIKYASASKLYVDIENRGIFKWYFTLHPSENIDNIKSSFDPSEYEDNNRDLVRRLYTEELGRDIDIPGLEFYTNQLNHNTMTPDKIREILRASLENKINTATTAFFEMHDRTPNSKELVKYHNAITGDRISSPDITIAYCQMTHKGDVFDAISNVKSVEEYVDHCIVVYDDSITSEDRQQLRDAGASIYYYRWHDHFPEMRNNYLEIARIFAADWVLVTDPDEHFDTQFLLDIRNIVKNADEKGYVVLRMHPHDILSDDDNGVDLAVPTEIISDYWKLVVYKLEPNVHYTGFAVTKNIHENLVTNGPATALSRKYFYRHIKSHKEIWLHAARNVYIGGGGLSMPDKVPYYREFKDIMQNLGLATWYQFRDYLLAGNADDKLKDFIIRHKDVQGHEYDSEYRELYKIYFNVLHPDEKVKV